MDNQITKFMCRENEWGRELIKSLICSPTRRASLVGPNAIKNAAKVLAADSATTLAEIDRPGSRVNF